MGPGEGKIRINQRPIEDFFTRETLRMIVQQPLALTSTEGQFDFYILTNGGGISGQAGAVRHGISKALEQYNPGCAPRSREPVFSPGTPERRNVKNTDRREPAPGTSIPNVNLFWLYFSGKVLHYSETFPFFFEVTE